MNGRRENEGPYKSQRPASEGKRTVRLHGDMGRASRVLGECDVVELQHFLCAVVTMGWAITITGTSDGGAVSLTLYDGDTRYKAYGRDAYQLQASINSLLGIARGEE